MKSMKKIISLFLIISAASQLSALNNNTSYERFHPKKKLIGKAYSENSNARYKKTYMKAGFLGKSQSKPTSVQINKSQLPPKIMIVTKSTNRPSKLPSTSDIAGVITVNYGIYFPYTGTAFIYDKKLHKKLIFKNVIRAPKTGLSKIGQLVFKDPALKNIQMTIYGTPTTTAPIFKLKTVRKQQPGIYDQINDTVKIGKTTYNQIVEYISGTPPTVKNKNLKPLGIIKNPNYNDNSGLGSSKNILLFGILAIS